MKNILKGFIFALAMVASSAQAIPTLFFDGNITFNASTGVLSVTSTLVDTIDINPTPELLNSSLTFSASFLTSTSSTYATVGQFSGIDGDDLSVIGGDLSSLLIGEFSSLTIGGVNGNDFGRVSGVVNATGGSLEAMFGAGNLFALELNLSTAFGADMFDADFNGNIDGRIEGVAVPEPGILAILGLGLALMGFINIRTKV